MAAIVTCIREAKIRMDLEKLFRANLIRLMKEHGISGAELARMLDMSPTDVSRWVKGHVSPRLPKIGLLCERTGWTPEEFFKPLPGEERPKTEIGEAERRKSVSTTVQLAGYKAPRLISDKKPPKKNNK